MENYDFSGWATRNNLRCSDGRTIMKDAFKHCDGAEVPLVWNHQHNDPDNILGKALLHNRDEGVYAYCTFNDSESGKTAKQLVRHGDIKALSIYANQLKEHMSCVSHGVIREVSLVLAGANPGAYIENVIKHGEEFDSEAIIYTGEDIMLSHSDEDSEDILEHADENKEETVADVLNTLSEKQKNVVYALIGQALKASESSDEEDEDDDDENDKSVKHSSDAKDDKEETDMAEDTNKNLENEETVADVFETLSEKQKTVVYALVGQALKEAGVTDEDDEVEHSDYNEGDEDYMKHNIFENDEFAQTGVLSHAEQKEIIDLAKQSSVGSLRTAMQIYTENNNSLAHGIAEGDIAKLFPDYKDVYPGAPELLERDHGWVAQVMKKAHKSPVSRIRTRHADARAAEVRAKGYTDRKTQKAISGDVAAVMRTTDPQTIYYRDALHRDDVVDITDFDVIAYQKNIMQRGLEEEVAQAALIGDGRADDHADKISPNNIRPIWTDTDVYTIKATLDLATAKAQLQGTETGAHFGENYVFTEAMITTALYAREQYKGNGLPDFYCAPHTLNMMLLARDLNGRRMYESAADLAKVLNVGEIFTVEQMAGKTRTDDESNEYKLHGIFVNMANYTFGCAKGGEITNFEDFDIDFNQYKYLMETRLSGALTHPLSAIAVEELVSAAG